jgi:hypothetical protein
LHNTQAAALKAREFRASAPATAPAELRAELPHRITALKAARGDADSNHKEY